MGFGLYGSIHGPTDYQVNIQVTYGIKANILTLVASSEGLSLSLFGRIVSFCIYLFILILVLTSIKKYIL